jgi:choline dehydrogenase-like flavoprotein
MTKQLPGVDVVLVGFGWTGAIYAEKLTDAGLDVLALERGPWRDTTKDFATTFAQDELRYYWRHGMFDAQLGLVPAGQRRRRVGRALERPDLSLPAFGFRGQEP